MSKMHFLAGVATVDILVADQLVATASTMINNSISIGSTSEDIRGGSGGKLLGKYYHTSTLDITLTDVLFKLEYLAFQTGSPIQQIADVFTSEQVTLGEGGAGKVSLTPAAYQNYGTIGWISKPGEDTYTKITFAEGGNFTVTGGEAGDIYCVKYINTDNAARKITISSTFIPDEVTLVMTASLYRAGGRSVNDISHSSKIGTAQIYVPRFIFSGAQELSMTATGVSNSDLSGSALDNPSADCQATGYYAIITENIAGTNWYDNIFALAIEDSDIELSATEAAENHTQKLSVYALPVNGSAFKPPYEDLTFTSGADATATVDTEGTVTGVAAGSTTISVAITKKAGVEAVANVTVE